MRNAGSYSAPLQTVGRVGELLDLFSPLRTEIGLSELARDLNVSKATGYRLAESLVAIGLLDQDPITRSYRLGIRLLEHSSLVSDSLDIRRRVLPVMKSLRSQLGETVYLLILRDRRAVCVERLEGIHPFRDLTTQIGSVLPLYVGAAPMAMLAYIGGSMVDEVLAGTIERRTPATCVDPSKIRVRLSEIRKRGYAIALEDLAVGTGAVAAPILSLEELPVAAISVGGLAQLIREKSGPLGKAVLAAAAEASVLVGGKPNTQYKIENMRS
jgi:DNA-binding IclR family transcriptional regulator